MTLKRSNGGLANDSYDFGALAALVDYRAPDGLSAEVEVGRDLIYHGDTAALRA
jgi:hypothetical protein